MDGTLLNDEKKLTEENIKAIKQVKEKGIFTVISTGRPISGVKPYLNMFEHGDIDFLVCNNGAVVYNVIQDKIIHEEHFKRSEIEEIIQMADDLEISLHFLDSNQLITHNNPINKYIILDAYLSDMDIFTKTPSALANHEHIHKALFTADSEMLNHKTQLLPQWFVEKYNCVRSDEMYFEILKENVDKASGLKKIMRSLEIDRENVIAIGDQQNDIQMLNLSGLAIAMHNASPLVKEMADIICPDNNSSGVSQVLSDIFFCLNDKFTMKRRIQWLIYTYVRQ